MLDFAGNSVNELHMMFRTREWSSARLGTAKFESAPTSRQKNKAFYLRSCSGSLWLQGACSVKLVSAGSWEELSPVRQQRSIKKWYWGNRERKLWWICKLLTLPALVHNFSSTAPDESTICYKTLVWSWVWACIMRLSKNYLPGLEKDELLSCWNQLNWKWLIPQNYFSGIFKCKFVKEHFPTKTTPWRITKDFTWDSFWTLFLSQLPEMLLKNTEIISLCFTTLR